MSRYLNEGAVWSAVKRIPHITVQTRQAILEALRKVPTADVVEVVRCKDCRHYETRDILNYRYNEFKTTILTGEYSPSEIIKVDEALGGRIVEMTEPDYLIVLLGKDKNQRLNGGKIL